jgi:hypothetical protein
VTETATPTHSAQGLSNALPWAVAAIAILSLIALAAGQRFARASRPATASSVAATTAGNASSRAPDISSLTPLERAERLYERIMGAAQRGRTDTVRFFMPMAVQAYEALAPMTIDQRYDLGRLGEVADDAALVAAQADTILRQQPQHLLGLVLTYRAARLRRDQPAMRDALGRLARVADQELQRQLPEYLLRQADIDSAVAQLKRR